jgi:(2R)-ethylmalonyl-CoA mutase
MAEGSASSAARAWRERTASLAPVRAKVRALGDALGRNLKVLVSEPGLGGIPAGAEPIAVCARDAGFEVVYEGGRVTAAQLAQSAVEEGVHLVALGTTLSGGPEGLVPDVIDALRGAGAGRIPVVVVGVLPEADARALEARGVARVYAPGDFALGLVEDLADVVRPGQGAR